MSWPAVKWARKQRVGSGSAKAVLVTLSLYADDTGYCWPSQETIAAEIECSVDSVQRALKKNLVPTFVRRIKRKSSDGRRISDAYQLNLGRNADSGRADACGPALCGPADAGLKAAETTPTEPQNASSPDCTLRLKSTEENNYDSSYHRLSATAGGSRLEKKLGKAAFDAWFRNVVFIEQRDEMLVLGTERRFFAQRIEQQFEPDVIKCFQPEYPRAVRVRVILRKDTG
jgi:hypothetical protein